MVRRQGERPPFSPSRPNSKSTASLRPIASPPTLPVERGVLSTPFAGTAPSALHPSALHPFAGTASLGSPPTSRAHVASIGQWMERELVKLRTEEARKGTSETHVLKAARAIYSVAFREVTRQVTVVCAEWGALLSKIFAVHSDLLDGMIAERERWLLAEAAARVTQQQAADATKLRAKVARMLLSTQQMLATLPDDDLRSAADHSKDGGRIAPVASRQAGGMSELLAAKETLRPQDAGGLSSQAERPLDEQARLARTLELAATLGDKGAEMLLRTLMTDAGALPSVGTEARLLAAVTLTLTRTRTRTRTRARTRTRTRTLTRRGCSPPTRSSARSTPRGESPG